MFIESKTKTLEEHELAAYSAAQQEFARAHLDTIISAEDSGISSGRLKFLQLAKFLLGNYEVVLVEAGFLQGNFSSYLLSILTSNLENKTLIAAIEDETLLPFFDESVELERGEIVECKTLNQKQ